jgi:hypothetical protein
MAQNESGPPTAPADAPDTLTLPPPVRSQANNRL